MNDDDDTDTRDGPARAKHRNNGLRKRCDCPRRQWPKCAHPWHFNVSVKGTPYRISLDKELGKHVETKADAKAAAANIVITIREGTFRQQVPTTVELGLTLGDVADKYIAGYVKPARRKEAAHDMELQVKAWRRVEVSAAHGRTVRLELKPIDTITKADVLAYVELRRGAVSASGDALKRMREIEAESIDPNDKPAVAEHRARIVAILPDTRLARRAAKSGEVGINRMLRRLHHLFTWALDSGYATRTPFTRDGTLAGRSIIKQNQQVETPRRRRLDGDEERRLLDNAGPHLRAMIEGALETGCRRGELLTLQWQQVNLDAGIIVLPADKTKTSTDRVIPVTARLKAILDMRRTGPDGKDLPPDAFVFGNECGEEVKSIKTAWRLTCRRAKIDDLHFHDLRREFGSRLLETPGTSLHEVRDWLGHANISQTSTYLATTASKLQAAARRFEMRSTCTNLAQNGNGAPESDSDAPQETPANSLH